MGTILGVTILIRTIVFWGLYWGPILGNYHIGGVVGDPVSCTMFGEARAVA